MYGDLLSLRDIGCRAQGDTSSIAQALRSLCVLVLMLGKHLPGHVPPVMVLLTAAVSRAITSSMELQLQVRRPLGMCQIPSLHVPAQVD